MKELVIYGKTDCSQCDSLLTRLGNDNYTYLTLGIDFTREELMNIAETQEGLEKLYNEAKKIDNENYVSTINGIKYSIKVQATN